MKLVSFQTPDGIRLGAVVSRDGTEQVVDLHQADARIPADLGAALALGVDLPTFARAAASATARAVPLAHLEFAPLVPRPGKVVCLGLNYADHAKEGGRERPAYPWFFLRGASSLLGHGQPALRPRVSEQFDYEAELALVIGQRTRHAKGAAALDAVFGYSCFNDISVRDYQRRTPQWTVGKNFDATGAFGPVLVTADELPPGATGLGISARLNGQTVQQANTTDMLFGVQETIELLSECMTLEPGDVIVMGTPAGVGVARTPPLWMRHGDVIEVEIEGLGTLRNAIVDER